MDASPQQTGPLLCVLLVAGQVEVLLVVIVALVSSYAGAMLASIVAMARQK